MFCSQKFSKEIIPLRKEILVIITDGVIYSPYLMMGALCFYPGANADTGWWWRWMKIPEISGFREWVLCRSGSVFRQLCGRGCQGKGTGPSSSYSSEPCTCSEYGRQRVPLLYSVWWFKILSFHFFALIVWFEKNCSRLQRILFFWFTNRVFWSYHCKCVQTVCKLEPQWLNSWKQSGSSILSGI